MVICANASAPLFQMCVLYFVTNIGNETFGTLKSAVLSEWAEGKSLNIFSWYINIFYTLFCIKMLALFTYDCYKNLLSLRQ